MTVWPLAPLGELLFQHKEYVDVPESREYPKLSVKLYGKGVTLDAPADGTILRMHKHQIAKAGQVILSEIWGKKGAIGFVPPQGDGALCTSHFFLFEVRTDRVNPKWLHAIFTANYLAEQLDSEAKGTTGYAAVRPAHLLRATIPLPPLEEQARIIERIEFITSRVDHVVRLREQVQYEAHVLWKRLLAKIIGGCGGAEVRLHEVCSAIIDNLHRNPIYAVDGVPCVRSPDVGWGTLNLESSLRTDEAEYQQRTVRGEPVTDDIVLVREGGGTGKAALVMPGQRFSLGQRVMMIRPDKTQILPKFFLYQILSPLVQEEQIQPVSKGSAAPHLNIGALREFRLTLPTLERQKHLVNELDQHRAALISMEEHQSHSKKEIDALIPSLLNQAFSGRL